ncbi:MAG: amidohydrolase [Acidaminococcales bacterium]|jgi:aminocarboxymuconate-semialdehyde decarboxylase|nr:amidohydrolase [Acidaminococcales bacterium]
MRVIDIHAHVIPPAFFELAAEGVLKNIAVDEKDGRPIRINFGQGSFHPLTDLFLSLPARLAFMENNSVGCQVISVSPRLFFYDLPPAKGQFVCRKFNDDLLSMEKSCSGKQLAMGSVPLQDPLLAAEELERLSLMGVRSVQIGAFVNGQNLADRKFWPFFAAAEQLGVSILLHPLINNDLAEMSQYHLSNLVGNPWQTTVAAANLLFCGVFDAYPGLKILLAHGGGFLPYQAGRLTHGYKVRGETKKDSRRPPAEYIRKNFFFDALTHNKAALAFLLQSVGADRVLFGTDFPYDMAEYDELEKIKALGEDEAVLRKIAGENALKWLGK